MDEIMTIEEVARYFKLKPQTIYTWAQKGKIPAAKLGKEWRFKRSVIDRWFNQHIDQKFSEYLEE
jgi:PTS system nitrogen regulatory IIA component